MTDTHELPDEVKQAFSGPQMVVSETARLHFMIGYAYQLLLDLAPKAAPQQKAGIDKWMAMYRELEERSK